VKRDEFRADHSDVDLLMDFGEMDSFDRTGASFDILDQFAPCLASTLIS